jgi:hypothetical protein
MDSEEAIKKLRYMHRNPVKRGLVVKPEDWPWSSFRHYMTGAEGVVGDRVRMDGAEAGAHGNRAARASYRTTQP